MQKEKTIQFRGLDLTIRYDYQAEEKPVCYDSNMEGYPGCSEEYTIEQVLIDDLDITRLFEDENFDNEIIELLKS